MSGLGAAPVSLRPTSTLKKGTLEPDQLIQQILQVYQERGPLRNITEQSLEDEIESSQAVDGDAMEGVEGEGHEDDITKEKWLKDMASAKWQMFQEGSQAVNAASNLLDLLALILTKDPNKNVNNSFSARFQHAGLPIYTIAVAKQVDHRNNEYDRNWYPYEEERDKLAARGSRMHALDYATDNILKAATQLETEVRKEVKYWDEILSISQKGWSLQRFRKNVPNSPFAVHYGFSEASSHFKKRGFAPLQMDEDGSIILDPALALQPKVLRVRIMENGKTTGTSSLAVRNSEAASAIENSIQLARDSLFEEEIYHEISMETRELLSYGVELRDSVVHLAIPTSSPRSSQRMILIDCIAREDMAIESSDDTHDWLANSVAEALRFLLAHEHRMRLYRRSQIPRPLVLKKREVQSPPLLRTLLASFSHISCIRALSKYLGRAAKFLDSAGLKVSLDISGETSLANIKEAVESAKRQDLPPLHQILETFVKPFEGVAKLTLPSSAESEKPEQITIAVRTFFGPPTFGTEYIVTLPQSLASALNPTAHHQRSTTFSTVDEVKSYIDWLLSVDLAQNLLLKEYADHTTARSSEPRITVSVRDGKKMFKKDVAVSMAGGALTVLIGPAPLVGMFPSTGVLRWDGRPGELGLREKVRMFVGPGEGAKDERCRIQGMKM